MTQALPSDTADMQIEDRHNLYRIEQELGTEIAPIPTEIDPVLYVAPSSIAPEPASPPRRAPPKLAAAPPAAAACQVAAAHIPSQAAPVREVSSTPPVADGEAAQQADGANGQRRPNNRGPSAVGRGAPQQGPRGGQQDGQQGGQPGAQQGGRGRGRGGPRGGRGGQNGGPPRGAAPPAA